MVCFPKPGFKRELRLFPDPAEVSSNLCAGEADLRLQLRSQCFAVGEQSLESSVVKMASSHTFNQGMLHSAKANSFFAFESPLLSSSANLEYQVQE